MEQAPPVTPPPAPPPPPPPPPPAPPAPEPTHSYQEGGMFQKFDWVEIGFMALGAAALFLIIDFYRQKAKQEKRNQAKLADVEGALDKMQMEFNGVKRILSSARRA